MPKRFSSREVERLLEANGFRLVHQVGSHRKFTNGPRRAIVPAGRKEHPPGTLGSNRTPKWGSTPALGCGWMRPRIQFEDSNRSRGNIARLRATPVFREGAENRTRGRVRSPSNFGVRVPSSGRAGGQGNCFGSRSQSDQGGHARAARSIRQANATRVVVASGSQPRVGEVVTEEISLIDIWLPRVFAPLTATSAGLQVCWLIF